MNRKSIMAIGAHSDDIEFLMGGTLLKYQEKFGYEVVYVESTNNMSGRWFQATEGDRARTAPVPPRGDYKQETSRNAFGVLSYTVPWFIEMPQRKKEAAESAHIFFHTEPIHLDHPQRHYMDGELKEIELCYGSPRPECVPEGVPSILTAHENEKAVEQAANLILEKNPETVITHAPVDYTGEHTSTSHLVRKAYLKAQKSGYGGSLIFALAVTSGSYGDFFDHWDTFVDITGFEEKKRNAIGMHASQVVFPERIGLEDCARGKVCGIGAAETFYVFELSKNSSGEFTLELARNNEYCRTNWSKMFFHR